MMKILAILQARMTSSRLPGKVLLPVLDKPLLQWQCERVLQAKHIGKLVIATSTDPSDDAIEELGIQIGVSVFRGDLDDVLNRFYGAALKFEGEALYDGIARLTGDCPLIDPKMIDEMINAWQPETIDYYANTLSPTYPDGFDFWLFTFKALQKSYQDAKYLSQREHVTLYMHESDEFTKKNHEYKEDYSHLRLTVDETTDFELVRTILEALFIKYGLYFSLEQILDFLKQNENLLSINKHITRDEGLQKSLREEGRLGS